VAGEIRPVALEDNVGIRIVRLAEVFARLARIAVEAPTGLRHTDLRILNLLDGTEGISIVEIARRTYVDKAWISRSVQHLIARGLVEKRVSPQDSRLTLAALTAAGRALLDDIRPAVASGEQRVLEGIDEAVFKQGLDRLLHNAEQMLAAAERCEPPRG
jgi:DNA-binding MarR family transcriptional regulator